MSANKNAAWLEAAVGGLLCFWLLEPQARQFHYSKFQPLRILEFFNALPGNNKNTLLITMRVCNVECYKTGAICQ